jgi:phage tail-like protein
MATRRDNPYGRFNFLVEIEDAGVVGGFSDVSGLGIEVSYSEYRTGDDPSTVRRIPTLHRVSDVVLRRGVIGSTDLFDWLEAVSEGEYRPRPVAIALLNEKRETVVVWRLRQAQPKKWTGPTLNAKAGGEVAMEELVLVAESITFE